MKITLNELRKIIRSVLKEEADIAQEPQMKAAKAAEIINKTLSPDEIDFLKSMYKNLGEKGMKREVVNILSLEDSINEYEYDSHGELTDKQIKLRRIINKIIKVSGALALLGIVPAAMFISGATATASGITALTLFLFKDAAWWNNRGGLHRDVSDKYNEEPIFYDDDY